MTELDAQHRTQLAEALRRAIFPNAVHAQAKRDCVGYADALAPLVAEWLADAWDAGRKVGRRDGEEIPEHRHAGNIGLVCHSHDGATHWHDNGGPAYTITRTNPYRGGDS